MYTVYTHIYVKIFRYICMNEKCRRLIERKACLLSIIKVSSLSCPNRVLRRVTFYKKEKKREKHKLSREKRDVNIACRLIWLSFRKAPVIRREVEQMSWTIFRPDVSSVSAWKHLSRGAETPEQIAKADLRLWNEELRGAFHYLQEPRWENIHWPVSTPWRCHPRASSRSPGSWDGSAPATSWGCTGRMQWSALKWSPMTPCPAAPCRQNLPRTDKLH